MLKLHEVRERMKRAGVDPRVTYVIEAVVEEQYRQRQELKELASLLDIQATILTQLVEVGGQMKSAVEMINKNRQGDSYDGDIGPLS